MKTRQPAQSGSLHPICSAQVVLANLTSYVLKLVDAPCSAQSHFDHAIFALSEMCRDWNPSDADVVKVIRDAREHMAHYFEKAKAPWPNALHELPPPCGSECNQDATGG
mgnify:CR=1 FL=1